MSRKCFWRLIICFAAGTLLAGCASAPESSSSVIKTLHNAGPAAPYSNVLVISAAGNRESRGQFEQQLIAAIGNEETTASAFFAVAGRYTAISRSLISNAVKAREFDSVLLVRRQGQDRPELVPNRPTGRQFDFFHYDYEELNDLTPIRIGSTVAFVVEVYDTADARKIWAIESLVFDTRALDSALEIQIANIAAELRRDRLFAD